MRRNDFLEYKVQHYKDTVVLVYQTLGILACHNCLLGSKCLSAKTIVYSIYYYDA